ncbi:multidrug DMT transporter permease [Rheinheimera riviphila]|uniref:Multidrug DMT transporter permease n=1 Tax=Rheinheimera riviphila TaxID=1834037 RepID=A0A437R264_9GAMM|nr:YebG family protein [Rheinheimera riviphila]RVU40889.1 multidrug DMT transporter permease [Rheinheimera riviphila]
MAVIVKYVIERNGVEKMTFAAKSEADAYDKMLDIADELFVVLGQSQLLADESQQESLALYLAQNKDEILQALGAKAKTVKKDKAVEPAADLLTATLEPATESVVAAKQAAKELIIVRDEDDLLLDRSAA